MTNYKNILKLIFPFFLIFFLSSCASIVYLNETGIYLIQEIDDVKNEAGRFMRENLEQFPPPNDFLLKKNIVLRRVLDGGHLQPIKLARKNSHSACFLLRPQKWVPRGSNPLIRVFLWCRRSLKWAHDPRAGGSFGPLENGAKGQK